MEIVWTSRFVLKVGAQKFLFLFDKQANLVLRPIKLSRSMIYHSEVYCRLYFGIRLEIALRVSLPTGKVTRNGNIKTWCIDAEVFDGQLESTQFSRKMISAALPRPRRHYSCLGPF